MAALDPIRDALEAGDYARAHAQMADWDGPVGPEALDLRGRAAYGAGDLEAALGAYEALHRLHLDAGQPHDAAQAAVIVAMYLMMDTGLMAPVRAWLARAERLLADAPDSPVHAWLAAVATYERFMCGDMPGAGRCARRAIEGGKRHGLAPPAIIGRTALGRIHIHDGDVERGLAMLDDVAIDLSTGQLDPMTTGQMWCEVICAMQWVGQHDRAEEWTAAMERWRQGAAFGGLHGRCRVHRAEILRMRGPCDEAEQEALLACEELRPWMRREYGWPLSELGAVRLRKGDLAGAEEAFLAAHRNAWTAQPGLALVRLAQGRVDEAACLIQSALDDPFDVPSKEFPPSGGLRRAPLLEAQVHIALRAGQLEVGAAAAEELARIADTYQSRTLRNRARAAQGLVALAQGQLPEAIEALNAAVAEWVALRMPFEAATVRIELARARQQAGNAELAALDLDAACRELEALGAPYWSKQARDPGLDRATPAAPRAEPAACVFRCEGDTRTICFDGSTRLLKDLKGMRYLERLLMEPDREFHALDLIDVERGALPFHDGPAYEGASITRGQAGLEAIDSTAREAYRRRLHEVEEDIAEAEAHNDLERARLARADRHFLVDELARGVGLDGRARSLGGGAERARTSATRAIRYALDRIAEHHPSLARHLRHAIRTGTYFSYAPDPAAAVRWQI